MTESNTIKLGILGCGNVGGALVRLLSEGSAEIAARTGINFEVHSIAVRSPAKERDIDVPASLLTDDTASVVNDPEVDVVVELIGGIEPARGLIARALESGKPVVTANKELIANVGAELSQLAKTNSVELLYEAAVGGGIPVVRSLRESLAGEQITRILGIVNGTTNYILTRMAEDGVDYANALAEAQGRGYAERDPTADVEGFDAAAKAAILANVAFGAGMVAGDVYSEGISQVTQQDIELADRLGYVVKLLAVVDSDEKGRVGARVHPTMIPKDHPLASVRLSFNALYVQGEACGELMFYGRGAGGAPTASAVLGDLIAAARAGGTNSARVKAGGPGAQSAHLWPIDEQSSPFYVSIDLVDKPGVLAAVAGVFGDNDVSIRSMEQLGLGSSARLILITHEALERDFRATLHGLRKLQAVKRVGNVMRVMERE